MKKLVHLADLHLGATLHDRERLAEQKHFLKWLCDRLAEESPRADLLVVAGDVFDGRAPSPAARTVWYDFLARLRDPADPLVGAVVAIAGNHASAPALQCAGGLARHSGIRIVADGPTLAEDEAFAVPCADGGALAVAAVPFLRESRLRNEAPAGTEPSDALQAGFRAHFARAAEKARAAAPAGSPLVVVGHCAVQGAKAFDAPDAEIRVVGNMVEVPASALPEADYVALGHLHVPQGVAVPRGKAFYAGSPYPVGTGELSTPKSVPFATFRDQGPVSVDRRVIDAAVLRRIRAFSGTPDEIAKAAKDFVSRHPGADAPESPVSSAWFTATVTGGDGSLDELNARLEEIVRGTGAQFFGLREGRERSDSAPLPSYDPATFSRLDPGTVAELRLDAAATGPDRRKELLDLVREAAAAAPADGAEGEADDDPVRRIPSRILSVELSNLNSLKGRATIDLENLRKAGGTFAVAGDTGAGKTTILDAITLALYGQTARQEGEITHTANEVMTRTAAFCRAAVRFRGVDGHVYRAVWAQRRKKRAKGLDPYRHELRDETLRAPNGGATSVYAGGKSKECALVVSRLIGFTYEEFTRIVLLSQGRFDQFLKADEETRAAILEKVTGTQRFSRIGREINRRKLEAHAALEKARGAAGSSREALEKMGDRAALEEAKSKAAGDARKARSDADALRQELDWTVASARLEADEEAFAADDAEQRRAKDAFGPDRARLDAARRAGALANDRHALELEEGRVSALEDRIRELDAAILAIDRDLPGLRTTDADARRSVDLAQEAIKDRRPFLDDIDARDRDIVARTADLKALAQVFAAKRKAAERAAETLSIATTEADGAARRAAAAEAFWNDGTEPGAEWRGEVLFRTIAAARDAQKRIDAATAPIAGLEKEAERAKESHAAADDAANAEAKKWAKERNGLEVLKNLAVQAESKDAKTMRAHLVDGRPCPVCGVVHRGTGETPIAIDLPPSSRYAKEIADGDAAQTARTNAVGDLLAKWKEADRKAQAARATLDRVRIQTAKDIADATNGVAAARQDATTRSGQITALFQAEKDAVAEAEAAKAKAEAARKVLEQIQAERTALYGTGTPQAERDRLGQELSNRKEKALKASAELATAMKERKDDQEERARKEVERRVAEEERDRRRKDFDEARGKAGFATDDDWRAALLSDDATNSLAERERELRDEDVRLYGADGSGGERKRLAGEEARLRSHGGRRDVRRPAKDVEGALALAEGMQRETAEAAGAAEHALETYDKIAGRAAADEAALAPIEKAAKDWAELDTMLGGEEGKLFRLFAQRLNFRNLVLAADPHLQAMSGRRYRFAWKSAGASLTDSGKLREEKLHVIDAEQSGTRPVSNLSGGESFFASLALALGFAALRGGGACENLFLDEGFGTLDRESLDAAVDVLERIGSQGTLVGVITHMDEVVNALGAVIEAVKGGRGSRLRDLGGGNRWVSWSDDPGPPPDKKSADGATATTA